MLLRAGLVLVALIAASMRYNIPPEDSALLAALQRGLGINQPASRQGSAGIDLIGHRGAGNGPGRVENTSGAIQSGIDAGVGYIEIDVRRCEDQLILFHDEAIGRIITGKGNAKIAALSLSEIRELQKEADPSKQIISLDEALRKFESPGVRWVIDIKEEGMRDELVERLNSHGLGKDSGRVIFLGKYDMVKEYKATGYPLAYCATWGEGWSKVRFVAGHSYLLERCDALGANLAFLVLPDLFLRESLVAEAKGKGLGVWTYRGELATAWHHSLRLGVTGLIVDDVEAVAKEFL